MWRSRVRTARSCTRSIPGISLGEDFATALAGAARSRPEDHVLVFGFTPPLPEGYLAVISLARSELLPSRAFYDAIVAGIIALAAIFAFSAVMSIRILRSITASVVSLEAATRRVAAGELDLPIAAEGSNEMASLARSLNRMREELKEDQARRARFIMGISHDLKTPLALVKGYAEALEEELGDPGPEAAAHLGIIQDKTDQLEGMIDDLIDFERVDTGEWRSGLSEVDLGPFLTVLVKRLSADAELLGRFVSSSILLPSPALVRMDERLVSRALENLVYNALRYSGEGGRVDISARLVRAPRRPSYEIEIADDGAGIAVEDLPHIFEPFYRGSSSRREQGMGLGLSIVKTVVESHGWEIEVGSRAPERHELRRADPAEILDRSPSL